MTMQQVSVIVPAKNEAHRIGALLGSLSALHYPTNYIEVIVCDNGSTDRTRDVCREAGARVLELPDLSIAALRNEGARVARHEVLAFVDADCTVSPDWLSAASPHLLEPSIVAAGSYPTAPPNGTWVSKLWNLKERVRPPVHEASWLPSMNLIIKRTAFEAIGGFDTKLRTCEDVDLCYRLRDRGGRIIWDEAISVCHDGEPSTLSMLFRKERWHGQDNLRGVRRHGFRREELSSVLLPVCVAACGVIPAVSSLAGPLGLLLTSPLLMVPPAIAVAGATRTALKAKAPWVIAPLSIVYLVYLGARASAIVRPE